MSRSGKTLLEIWNWAVLGRGRGRESGRTTDRLTNLTTGSPRGRVPIVTPGEKAVLGKFFPRGGP
eukprot:2520581-Pyramimonas_sp.AAC.1